MAIKLLTKKFAILLTITGLMVNLQASGGGELLSAEIRSDNQSSLQSGARTYMNYCLACHKTACL